MMYKKVQKWLTNHKDTWHKIAEELEVNYVWVYRVAKGEYKDPGVNKIEYIYRNYVEKG